MSNTDDGYGPLAQKKFTDKEFNMLMKVITSIFDPEIMESEELEEFKSKLIEQMDNMIYNATRFKTELKNWQP